MFTSGPIREGPFNLPYLNREVPVFVGPGGRPMVPVVALCSLLGLDAGLEIQRASRVLLWTSACLLKVSLAQGGRRQGAGIEACCAWCLSYPLDVGSWFWQVYPRVRDPELHVALQAFIRDTGDLQVRAWDIVRQRFEEGRRRVLRLPVHLDGLEDQLKRAQSVVATRGSAARERLETLALRCQALREQAETFARDWSRAAQALPVVDAMHVDSEGQVMETSSFTLFGTFSAQDSARLDDYERAAVALAADLDEFLGGRSEM